MARKWRKFSSSSCRWGRTCYPIALCESGRRYAPWLYFLQNVAASNRRISYKAPALRSYAQSHQAMRSGAAMISVSDLARLSNSPITLRRVIPYVDRLSDRLFVPARYFNGDAEALRVPGQSQSMAELA